MGPDLVASRRARFALPFLPLGADAFRALQRDASWAVKNQDGSVNTRVEIKGEELVAGGAELMLKVGISVALSIGLFTTVLTRKRGNTSVSHTRPRTQHAEADVGTKRVQEGMLWEKWQVH